MFELSNSKKIKVVWHIELLRELGVSTYLWLMLTISKRGEQMPPSPIRKLVPYAEAAKKKGIKVYHLNIGQPDIETPPAIMDAVRNTNMKVLEYTHSAGNESYRRKLVQYYESGHGKLRSDHDHYGGK
jgi:aspartate aminotransferase